MLPLWIRDSFHPWRTDPVQDAHHVSDARFPVPLELPKLRGFDDSAGRADFFVWIACLS
jgi:hypothetical protein